MTAMKTTRRGFIGEELGFAVLTGLGTCRLSGGRLLVPGTVFEDVCRARSTDGSAPSVAFAVS